MLSSRALSIMTRSAPKEQAHQTRMIPLYSMHRIQINPPPPPPLSEELTLKPELAMLRIRTRRCALCLTLCDWEQQQPPRPDSWCNLTEPGRPACADAELQGQVHDALEQIVSCNHNLQQVHFSAVSCNHNLQQVHSSCVGISTAFTPCRRSARSAEKCTCYRFDSHCSIFGPAATRHSCDRSFVSATESRWCRSVASRWAWARRPHTVHALVTGADQSEASDNA